MGAETRKIEKYGILKLLPEDRGAQNLIVLCDVIQLPYTEYLNVKSNPPKGHYGFACFMYKEYVREIVDIQFRRQVIFEHQGYVVQLAHQEYCNSKEIATQVGTLWNPTPVEYPILNFDEIRFKLEPGVVISVLKSSIPMKTCDSQGIVQPDLSPPSSYQPDTTPPYPPAEDAPVDEKIPLSAPYQGEDDNGNTYVRPLPPPPPGDIVYQIKTSYEDNGTTCSFTGMITTDNVKVPVANGTFTLVRNGNQWDLHYNGSVISPGWVGADCLPTIVSATRVS